MKKTGSFGIILGLLLLASLLLSPTHAAPPITNLYTLTYATVEGGSPSTVDPAAAYDTASGQLLQQVYDTLISFNGEHMDSYVPVLATSWTIQNLTVTPGTGPANVAYYSMSWYYRYTFQLTPNASWQDATYGNVRPADVAYSFKREMIEDYAGGPQWMMDEPLLGNAAGPTAWNIGNATSPGPDAATVGHMLDDSVQYNSTHVWLNIAFPGLYSPMLGILSQTWSAVLSENWIKNYVIGTLHRPDWGGTFGADYTGWLAAHFATAAPTSLDYSGTPAGALMMGSGPYMLTKLDYIANYWTVDRFPGYFRGWPAPLPLLAGTMPAGYVNEFTVTWNYDWETRKSMFLSGEVDFCSVPRQYISQMYNSSTPGNYPLDGIRVVYPLPTLEVDGQFFQFFVAPASPYGPYVPNGTFAETAIPYDFFGNPTWGIHVRKAFAYSFNYNEFIEAAFQGEAIQPATAIIPGLRYYDPTVAKYSYDLAKAAQEFQAVPGLWNTGFTITLVGIFDNKVEERHNDIWKANIEALNPKFHVTVQSLSFHEYIRGASLGELPAFVMSWLADYPDPHNFASVFYSHIAGWTSFAAMQRYYNPAMDALVVQGIATPEGPERAAVYTAIQKLAVEDCSSVPIAQPVGRLFERDWVVGWYFNPLYPDIYAYNLWKWYYVPESLLSAPAQPTGFNLPADVNYDGRVDMKDIGTVARSFGATAGPPINARWVFRADVNNDRKIDMKDIGYVAKQFGKSSAKWTPS